MDLNGGRSTLVRIKYKVVKLAFKSINNFVEGYSYYVKIDDVRSKYTEALGGTPDAIKEYISNIKPLIWIISDDGIGTLKTKNVFLENFSDYFQK